MTKNFRLFKKKSKNVFTDLHSFLSVQLELKQELQVRQKAIHETPDNEKQQQQAINGGSPTHKTAAVLDENNEKRDPTKSPTPAGYNNNNKLPNGSNNATPLKREIINKLLFFGISILKFFYILVGMTDAGISQAARHSALNIVGDLLRRVGVIIISSSLYTGFFFFSVLFPKFELSSYVLYIKCLREQLCTLSSRQNPNPGTYYPLQHPTRCVFIWAPTMSLFNKKITAFQRALD